MGASYGAGHYGMCGRAYDPRFLFAWPSAKSAVMGAAQLAGVISIVSRAATEARGGVVDEQADAGLRAMIEAQIELESVPAFLSGMLYDDGVIDPRDTRTVLGLCLSAIDTAEIKGTSNFGVFRMRDQFGNYFSIGCQPRRDRLPCLCHLQTHGTVDGRRVLRSRRRYAACACRRRRGAAAGRNLGRDTYEGTRSSPRPAPQVPTPSIPDTDSYRRTQDSRKPCSTPDWCGSVRRPPRSRQWATRSTRKN